MLPIELPFFPSFYAGYYVRPWLYVILLSLDCMAILLTRLFRLPALVVYPRGTAWRGVDTESLRDSQQWDSRYPCPKCNKSATFWTADHLPRGTRWNFKNEWASKVKGTQTNARQNLGNKDAEIIPSSQPSNVLVATFDHVNGHDYLQRQPNRIRLKDSLMYPVCGEDEEMDHDHILRRRSRDRFHGRFQYPELTVEITKITFDYEKENWRHHFNWRRVGGKKDSSFFTWSVQLIFSVLLQHHIWKLSAPKRWGVCVRILWLS